MIIFFIVYFSASSHPIRKKIDRSIVRADDIICTVVAERKMLGCLSTKTNRHQFNNEQTGIMVF